MEPAPGNVSDLTPSSGSLTITCAVDEDKRRNSKSRSKKCFERVVIGVVIATVWILLALPIALYHLPQVRHQQFCFQRLVYLSEGPAWPP